MYVIGEFILTHPRMAIPRNGNIYSLNEGDLDNHLDNPNSPSKPNNPNTLAIPYLVA